MSNNNNNFVRADGSVNCDNPRVCAAMIDGVATLLCGVMHDLKGNTQLLDMMDSKTKTDLDCIFTTLQMVRNSIGVDTDWYNEDDDDYGDYARSVASDDEWEQKS